MDDVRGTHRYGATETTREIFHSLNAVRGIAAIAVVLLHIGQRSGFPMAKSGYLAVDIFFLLSGFVIAHAYSARLSAGLTTSRFAWLRLARFFPLYLLGTAIGALAICASIALQQTNERYIDVAIGFLFSFFFLPSPPSSLIDTLFPLNPPAWSLFFELVVNVTFAALYRHITRTRLIAFLLLSGAVLLIGIFILNGSSDGHRWKTFPFGLLRASFSFTFGALLFRMRRQRPLASGSFAFLVAPVALGLLLFVDPKSMRAVFDALFVLCLSPLIVWAAYKFEAPSRWIGLSTYLGIASYCFYALHIPLLVIAKSAAIFAEVPILPVLLIIPAALMALCTYIDARFDRPMQKLLRSMLPSQAGVGRELGATVQPPR